MNSAPFVQPATDPPTRPTLSGSFGMSATTHWVGSATAQSVLERGGNAFDAAVAAAFVLHAVEPHLNGPGGDLIGIIAPLGRDPQVVCGQGPAPAAATISGMRADGIDEVPGAGALAATVPGAVPALLWMLERHGTWELGDCLAYAIGYLEDGHPAGPQLSRVIGAVEALFRTSWPSSADMWLLEGRAPTEGECITNRGYAATLRRLVQESERGGDTRLTRVRAAGRIWRDGFVAREIAQFVGQPHLHSDGREHRGLLQRGDLRAFEVSSEPPLSLDFRGTTVLKPGFYTQGPVMLQALAILSHFPDDRIDPSTAIGVHTITEVLKLALADRDTYYGDAHGQDAAPLGLLDPSYSLRRAALIGDTASLEYRPGTDVPGSPMGQVPPLQETPREPADPTAGEPTVARNGETRGDTCHVSVVDRWGNTVALTPSGGWLQSSPTIPALGFCLGSRLQMTWLDERSPSALVPGRRPRTTLSPTMLARGGQVVAGLGTPGGDQQDQWQLLYLLRTLVGGYQAQQAIDAPTFHTTAAVGSFWPRTWTPGGLVAEARLGTRVLDELERRGHLLTVSGDWTLGRLCVVTRDPASGRVGAAANPRGAQGYAAGR